MVPPDSIPNSEVKRSNADGSVGFPHVRVGHHQGIIREKPQVRDSLRFFAFIAWCSTRGKRWDSGGEFAKVLENLTACNAL